MVFSSLLFLFRFLPIMIIAYFAAPKRFRNGVLFIGSLIFYGWGEPVFITLLLFSSLVDFTHGKWIGKYLDRGDHKRARLLVISSMVINLGLLCFFKYTDFLIQSLNQILGIQIPLPGITLPIGISFYTFQTMSYTIDVYRGKAKVQNSIIAFGAYVSMFPQLIAGPIVRYSTIAEELTHRTESYRQFAIGIRFFVIGMGKKVLLANPIGALWNEIQGIAADERSILMAWMGIFAFGMQIYFDFSGYSDMAVGLGHMFGFHFPENFRYPYQSKSITEFWNRWHISLSTWFKEYVYIPLGGNRKGLVKQIRNIMVVWLLTGIWHGAGFNFLLWGVYFGCLLMLEKFILKSYLKKLPSLLQGAYTVLLVFLGWVLFAHEDMNAGILFYKELFGFGAITFSNARTWYLLMTYLPLIVITVIGSTVLPKTIWSRKSSSHETFFYLVELIATVGILIFVTAYLVDASYNPFLYFRF